MSPKGRRYLWAATVAMSCGWAAGPPSGAGTKALVQQLTAGAPAVQREAAARLAEIGAPSIEPLVSALRHEDKRVRFHAAWALKQIGAPAAGALGQVLAGRHAEAKYPAAHALAGNSDPTLLEGWLVAADDPDWRVRYYAVRALGPLMADVRAQAVIERALKDEAAPVHQTAAGIAARHGNSDGIAGLAALMHPGVDATARFDAAFALWELKDTRAAPALVRGLTDGDPRVRHHCAWALGDLKAEAGAEALVHVLETSTDSTLKHYAAVSLKQITGQEFGYDTRKWRDWLRHRGGAGAEQ